MQAREVPTVINSGLMPTGLPTQYVGFNNGVTIYPSGNDQTFIQKGYNKNAWVYAIVSKCAKKFSQIPWYHYKIKTNERKTWFDEYLPLTKDRLDSLGIIEAKKMRQKSVDQVIVDSPLSKLLAKPNRNQSGAQLREQLYGFKLLTGEGNLWMSRGLEMNNPPSEMFVIPKQNIALVKGSSVWDIAAFDILLEGNTFRNPSDNIIMWMFPSYATPDSTLLHLRGQSPLDAGLLVLQGSNEGAERMVAMNKNQGAAVIASREDPFKGDGGQPGPDIMAAMRAQFNNVVNSKEMAGKVAVLGGKWSFYQVGMDARQLALLEQSDASFKVLCNIYDVPWQLFGTADSYENRKQYKRDFIYDNIAVAAYSLRDEFNSKLIREFNLDRERDVIDVDIISLPELGEDQDKQAAFLEKMGGRLSYNEGRELLGYERINNPVFDQYYVNGNLQTLDQLNADIGEPLDLNNLNL